MVEVNVPYLCGEMDYLLVSVMKWLMDHLLNVRCIETIQVDYVGKTVGIMVMYQD